MNNKGIFNKFYSMPRFAPTLIALFVFSILLLFNNELPKNQRLFLIPSLIVYIQGTVIIGMINRLLGSHYVTKNSDNNEKAIPIYWRLLLWGIQTFWFIAFIYYLFLRKILI